MKLSDNFTLEEMLASAEGARKGIKNVPTQDIIDHLRITSAGLEEVRSLLGSAPIHILSGYRCPELNRAVGGASGSAHMFGWAADFLCPSFGTPLEICKAIVASNIKFDQIIYEGTWVHLSFDPKMRHDVLTARFHKDAPTSYTKGL